MSKLFNKKNEVRELLLQMTNEEIADFFDVSLEINLFAEEMKKRFAEKIIQGKSGWKNFDRVRVREEMQKRLDRIKGGEDDATIGLANYTFISWFNNKKEENERI